MLHVNRISLQKIYIGLFGRPADPSGIEFWLNTSCTGNDLNEIADRMHKQEEYKHLFSAFDNVESMINQLYLNLFARRVDTSELTFWNKYKFKTIPQILCFLISDGLKSSCVDSDQRYKDMDCLGNKVKAAEMFTNEIRSSSSWVDLYQPESYKPWSPGYSYLKAVEFLGSIKYGDKPTLIKVKQALMSINLYSKKILKNPIIEMKNVSLRIPLYASNKRALTKRILGTVTGGRFLQSKKKLEIAALNNLNLTIMDGERIALIGHNGSGKSSFLRLISGIYSPSSGDLDINVDVHPMLQKSFLTSDELTGVDAAKAHFLMINKNLLGFEDFLQDIIEFSGLGNYISLPIKSYSEGMSARLIFSILTGTNHDCLAIDEGFGTGDAEFFDKAEKRMKEFVDSSGTLLLASHSDELLKTFCKRGLLFKHGKVIYDGPLQSTLDYYHNHELYNNDTE